MVDQLGKWELRTNTAVAAAEAALAYKGLWQVEQAFRTLKTPPLLRPSYHWTERLVRGHIAACFPAFTLRPIFKQQLAEQSFAGSFAELVEGLSRVRAVLLGDGNGERYRLRDEVLAGAMPAFQALNIVQPRRVANGSTAPPPPTSVVPRDLLDRCTAILYAMSSMALSKSSQRVVFARQQRGVLRRRLLQRIVSPRRARRAERILGDATGAT